MRSSSRAAAIAPRISSWSSPTIRISRSSMPSSRRRSATKPELASWTNPRSSSSPVSSSSALGPVTRCRGGAARRRSRPRTPSRRCPVAAPAPDLACARAVVLAPPAPRSRPGPPGGLVQGVVRASRARERDPAGAGSRSRRCWAVPSSRSPNHANTAMATRLATATMRMVSRPRRSRSWARLGSAERRARVLLELLEAAEARVVLVDEQLRIEAEVARVGAQEPAHEDRTREDVEVLGLEGGEVLAADLGVLLGDDQVDPPPLARLAQVVAELEHRTRWYSTSERGAADPPRSRARRGPPAWPSSPGTRCVDDGSLPVRSCPSELGVSA